jgi:hypothetical protein
MNTFVCSKVRHQPHHGQTNYLILKIVNFGQTDDGALIRFIKNAPRVEKRKSSSTGYGFQIIIKSEF